MKNIEIAPIVNRLQNTDFDDSEKWRMLLLHKQKLEREYNDNPYRKAGKAVVRFLRAKGISINDIRKDHTINPFPVGRCSLEKLIDAKKLSRRSLMAVNMFLELNKIDV